MNNKKLANKNINVYILMFLFLPLVLTSILTSIYSDSTSDIKDLIIDSFVFFLTYLGISISLLYLNNIHLKNDLNKLLKIKYYKIILNIVLYFILYLILANIAGNLVTLLSNNDSSENQNAIVDLLSTNYAILILFSVIFFGPFVEEIIFRYTIFSLISNDTIAAFVSVFVFGLIHVLSSVFVLDFNDFIHILSYIASGIPFTLIYIKNDKNIIYPIILHSLFNFIAVLFIFFY